MNRIVILSDTHGLLRPEVLEHLSQADANIHGSDISTPAIVDTLQSLAPLLDQIVNAKPSRCAGFEGWSWHRNGWRQFFGRYPNLLYRSC